MILKMLCTLMVQKAFVMSINAMNNGCLSFLPFSGSYPIKNATSRAELLALKATMRLARGVLCLQDMLSLFSTSLEISSFN